MEVIRQTPFIQLVKGVCIFLLISLFDKLLESKNKEGFMLHNTLIPFTRSNVAPYFGPFEEGKKLQIKGLLDQIVRNRLFLG